MSRNKFSLVISISILTTLACNLFQAPVAVLTSEPPGTAQVDSIIPTNTAELAATPPSTSLPTSTTLPTASPTITLTPIPCNQARFVKDVNIPDGTKFSPNENFSKTWRLKNTGSCTWDSGYAIVFANGDAMSAPGTVQITAGTVPSGGEVDVSVNMKAPAAPGTYRASWKLRDASNTVFGVENSDNGDFWVEIKVIDNSPPAIPGWPVLQTGSQGVEVFAIQHLLRSHGAALTADGIFGPNTRGEVKAFQNAKGLAVDGIVGPKTWSALINGKTVKTGSSGDAVFAAQRLLNKFGYNLNLDGQFGPKTNQAVKDFQTKYGLQVDGIVGPQTWQALVSIQ